MRRLWGVVLTLLVLGPVPARAQTETETVEYYGLDALGSVRVVFDPSGAVVGRMDYAPFGEELYQGLFMPAERFAQLTRDGEAGLDYAQARMYQPRTGRFLSPDPAHAGLKQPQRWNRYAYSLNSPLGYVDTTGLMADSGYPSPTLSRVANGISSSFCGAEYSFDSCGGGSMFWDTAGGGGLFEFGGGFASAQDRGYVPGMPVDLWLGLDAHNQRVEEAFERNAAAQAQSTSPQASVTTEYTVAEPCTGPAPGCRAISLHPVQKPFYVRDADYDKAQKSQLAAVAIAGGVLARLSVEYAISDFVRFGPTVVSNQLVKGAGAIGATVTWGIKGGGTNSVTGARLPFHYHIHQYNWYRPWLWFTQTPIIKK